MALLKRKKSGLGDPMSVVTRFVNAANRHDAEGVAGCLHPDFDSIQPIYPSRNFRGADQVRRNWQAIFDAEPGFRLTVLRSASADNTVWLELHGAGRDAEVAGVFVMGVQGDRVRWARIYSALVEPVPEGEGEVVATSDGTRTPLHDVNQVAAPDADAAAGDAVVEEPLIAPVVNLEDGARTRRRRSSRRRAAEDAPFEPPADSAPDPEAEPDAQAGEPEPDMAVTPEAEPPTEVEMLVEPETPVPTADDDQLADDDPTVEPVKVVDDAVTEGVVASPPAAEEGTTPAAADVDAAPEPDPGPAGTDQATSSRARKRRSRR